MKYLECFSVPKGSSSTRSSLPMDIIVDEILTRASPETVATSRAVCKHINKATYEWNFVEKRHKRAEIVSGFFARYCDRFNQTWWQLKTRDTRELRLVFPLNLNKVEAVTKQGLILCKYEYFGGMGWSPVFFVCKPAARQGHEIPQPRIWLTSAVKFAMTVMSSSNPRGPHYKIVRFFKPYSQSPCNICYRCDVFDSATWQWRKLPKNSGYQFCEKLLEPVVSVGGFFYTRSSEGRILAFDWAAESWNMKALPTSTLSSERPSLLECEGKLGAVFMSHLCTDMEILVLKRGRKKGVETWIKRMRLSLNLGCLGRVVPLAMPCSDMVVFRYGGSAMCFQIGSSGALENRVMKSWNLTGNIKEVFWFESDEQLVDLKAEIENVDGNRKNFLRQIVSFFEEYELCNY